MDAGAARMYRTREFAELAGVTVRTLHHYDRLGLLQPRRTEAGYRLYQARDLERLEQIVALKFLALPLKRIKALLDRDALDLAGALRRQRQVLEQKRRLLNSALAAIREGESAIGAGRRPESAILRRIIEVIEMQSKPDWTAKYYTGEAGAKVEERKELWSPELQAECSRQWSELFRDIEAALDEDPAGEKAQSFLDRWQKLVEGFTGGDFAITQGLKNLYADRANWPVEAKQQMAPYSNKAVWSFIDKARAARKK